jgi:hypothetical protein
VTRTYLVDQILETLAIGWSVNKELPQAKGYELDPADEPADSGCLLP